jgi:hypothetical protein
LDHVVVNETQDLEFHALGCVRGQHATAPFSATSWGSLLTVSVVPRTQPVKRGGTMTGQVVVLGS